MTADSGKRPTTDPNQQTYKRRNSFKSSPSATFNSQQQPQQPENSNSFQPPSYRQASAPYVNVSSQNQPEYRAQGGFNAPEMSHYMNSRYQEVIASLSDPNTPETERPEIYRTTKKAWGAPTNPAAKAYNPVYTGAGAKSGMMANGVGFLETIKKQRSEIKK